MNPIAAARNFIAGILMLNLLGCVQSTSNNTIENVDEEDVIKSTMTAIWKAIEEKDIKKYATYIHPEFTQFGEDDPTLNIGKVEEVQAIREWFKVVSEVYTTMEEPLITVRGDVAWITYYWRDRGNYGEESFSSRGKSTRIFVKEKGKWLCIHGHYTLLEEE